MILQPNRTESTIAYWEHDKQWDISIIAGELE